MGIKLLSGPSGHPEIGDTVYSADGDEIGEIEFFYAPGDTLNRWAVKIGTDPDDHEISVIERVVLGGGKAKAVLLNVKHADTNQASVMIENNVEE